MLVGWVSAAPKPPFGFSAGSARNPTFAGESGCRVGLRADRPKLLFARPMAALTQPTPKALEFGP